MTLTESEMATAQNIAALLLSSSPDVKVRVAGFEQALRAMIAKLLLAGWPLNDAVRHSLVFGDAIINALDAVHQQRLQVH